MAVKPKASSRMAPSAPAAKSSAGITLKPPLTLEEHLHRIEVLGKRIDAYIQFMCKLGSQTDSSAEVKERAVIAFYKQMIVVESQLAKIHDEFRLE